jgi:transcriptional regulator with XRE-family HTH domain
MARKPTFHDYLHQARMTRGLSASELAERVGVSVPCVYLWESGRTRPREGNLVALCKALKLPIRATQALAGR